MYTSLSTQLRYKVDILELRPTPDTAGWALVPTRTVWAGLEEDTRKNIFSDIGIGARGVNLTLRPTPRLTLHNAIRWDGQFLFLTSIIPGEHRDRLDIRAARCTPADCVADADCHPTGPAFPAVLTEMYLRHDAPDLHREVSGLYALVTPKVVDLAPGSWVDVGGQMYRVELAHTLDEYKNEYEIRMEADC